MRPGAAKYVSIIFTFLFIIFLYYFAILNDSNETNSDLAEKYFFIDKKEERRILRIAQVSDLAESVPPKNYGSIERIVHYLTEEMVRRGHNVTLFAASDSNTTAKLISKWPSYRHNPQVDRNAAFKWLFEQTQKWANHFDVLHIHTDMFLAMGIDLVGEIGAKKLIMTMHWNMENKIYEKMGQFPVISVSNDQRRHAVGRPNFIGTVYHGIPKDLLKFVEKPVGKPYLVFLGRIDPTKQPDWAIQIAVKSGIPLKMAAKVDDYQRAYWEEQIKPMIERNGDLVEFVGEVDDRGKSELLGNALAFLFPINWPEPFGMVLIESMACGTPVIARRAGPVPEIVEEGISGLLFDGIDEAVEAVGKVAQIERRAVRLAFERRFTAEKMADGYEEIYYKMLEI